MVTLTGWFVLVDIPNNSHALRLICSSQYEPHGIVDKLHSRLSGSAPVVLHHPHLAVSILLDHHIIH